MGIVCAKNVATCQHNVQLTYMNSVSNNVCAITKVPVKFI